MKYAVLGTGQVGTTIATKLVELGNEVTIGSRSADNEKAVAWAAAAGDLADHGTFSDAAAAGEAVFNCTAGIASLDALRAAGADNLSGKLLIDVANALDFSAGVPPTLAVCNDDSLGEQIQRQFPDARVVKTLNTVNASVMVSPQQVPETTVFLSGDDDAAKAQVRVLLEEFGWSPGSVVDLGGISSARGTEMYLPLWLRMYGALGTATLNIRVVH
jgi:8-hydroxy-5-deazaflavin:NADPH oxidoreductase